MIITKISFHSGSHSSQVSPQHLAVCLGGKFQAVRLLLPGLSPGLAANDRDPTPQQSQDSPKSGGGQNEYLWTYQVNPQRPRK